jgi:FKBP-type peptidyl-prolyl cis-trans isomerase FklB
LNGQKKVTDLNMRVIQFDLLFSVLLATASVFADDNTVLTDDAEQASYSIGQQIGKDLKKQNIPLNETILRRGIVDGLNDTPPLVPAGEMNARLIKLKKNITSELREKAAIKLNDRRQQEQQIREDGIAFMKLNGAREDVVTTDSGLQYRVINRGSGPRPEAHDFVTIKYSAKTVDGREFDSSDKLEKLGRSPVFRADSVLPGFTEAIQLMQAGSKWEVVMPPELAYGRKGLLAHQTVILELELLSIHDKDPRAAKSEKTD